MPSENKTPNIGLNQWQGNEYPKRQDFVDDNLIIDTEIKNLKNTIENLNADGITFNNAIDDLIARLKRLEDAVMSNITGNPFEISLKDLDGLIVTGIWNKEKQRLEV